MKTLLFLIYGFIFSIWILFFKSADSILKLFGFRLSVKPKRIQSALLWGLIIGIGAAIANFKDSYTKTIIIGILAFIIGFIIMNIEFEKEYDE